MQIILNILNYLLCVANRLDHRKILNYIFWIFEMHEPVFILLRVKCTLEKV